MNRPACRWNSSGKLCFAHWLQELEGLWQYVVVGITDTILNELNNGEQSILDVLRQPRPYVVLVDQQFVVQSVSLTTWEQLPQDALPERGTI